MNNIVDNIRCYIGSYNNGGGLRELAVTQEDGLPSATVGGRRTERRALHSVAL